jgi:endo-1,3-1,4-beta-glycanase ExoK
VGTATSFLVLGASACAAEGGTERFQAPEQPAFPEISGPTPRTVEEPAPATSEFELAWQDDFDTFDASRWRLMTHSWDTNLAQFSTENVRFEAGLLSLLLTPQASDPAKPFRGVEMRSMDTLTYGKVEARVRLARGSGVVSSLVLLYTPWPADDWNELDVEYLGRYSDRIQFNTMVYTGAPTQAPVQVSVTPTQEPYLAPLAFDPSGDFHVYSIAWTPNEVRFEVDGQSQHLWSAQIARMKLPQNILLTIWASSAADWAGPVALDLPPTSADYDWIRVYRYKPSE